MDPLPDARGNRLTLTSPPERVVSLVPSLTELLSGLNLDRETVGLTRFCEHPEGWKDTKTIVGGTKNVRVDRVRELEPDLVLANLEENKKEVVEQIDEFAPVHVTLVDDLASSLRMIEDVGVLTNKARLAQSLASNIERQFQALPSFSTLRAAYLIWKDPWMTVGGDTFISSMMNRAGLHNVFADTTRYPTVTLQAIREQEPDVVLLSSEPYPFDDSHREELQRQFDTIQVHCVSGDLFSWYGSRLLKSPPYFESLRDKL